MKNQTLLLGAGVLSGVLSGWLFEVQFSGGENLRTFAPGIIFGVVVGVYLGLWRRKSLIRSLLFIPISIVAFMAAFFIALDMGLSPSPLIRLAGFFIAGGVGAGIIGVSMKMYFPYLFYKPWVFALAGGALGLPFVAANSIEPILLFILWQGGVAFLLGKNMDKETFEPRS